MGLVTKERMRTKTISKPLGNLGTSSVVFWVCWVLFFSSSEPLLSLLFAGFEQITSPQTESEASSIQLSEAPISSSVRPQGTGFLTCCDACLYSGSSGQSYFTGRNLLLSPPKVEIPLQDQRSCGLSLFLFSPPFSSSVGECKDCCFHLERARDFPML